jgi:hypothetical protein
MEARLLRAIYGIEFLVALIAALVFWNYVGGPTHLDYVPWPWKGLISLGTATCLVRLTASNTRGKAVRWVLLLCLLTMAGGLLSYYAHLNEPQDETDESDQTVPTSLKIDLQLARPIRQLHKHRPVGL